MNLGEILDKSQKYIEESFILFFLSFLHMI